MLQMSIMIGKLLHHVEHHLARANECCYAQILFLSFFCSLIFFLSCSVGVLRVCVFLYRLNNGGSIL